MTDSSWDETLIGDGIEAGRGAVQAAPGHAAAHRLRHLRRRPGRILQPGLHRLCRRDAGRGLGRAHRAAPSRRPTDARGRARARRLPENREYIVEARIRRHDGVYRWHRIHNKPVVRHGRRIGSIGTAVDIHDVRHANEVLEQRVNERTAELRASEARYRMLYNRTPMALHSVDARARLARRERHLDRDVRLVARGGHRPLADGVHDRGVGGAVPPAGLAARCCRVTAGSAPVEYQFVTRDGRVFDGRLSVARRVRCARASSSAAGRRPLTSPPRSGRSAMSGRSTGWRRWASSRQASPTISTTC